MKLCEKLCQKCLREIRRITVNLNTISTIMTPVNWDPLNKKLFYIGSTGIIYKEGPAVPESDCEFWAHAALNAITEIAVRAGGDFPK